MEEMEKALAAIKNPDLASAMRAMVSHQARQHEENRDNLKAIEKKLDNAFVDGDVEGHRRYHQVLIERAELRNQIVREALIQMGKVGGVAAAGWLLYAIWHAFKLELFK